jgi:hypothetical protein
MNKCHRVKCLSSSSSCPSVPDKLALLGVFLWYLLVCRQRASVYADLHECVIYCQLVLFLHDKREIDGV